MNSYISMDVMLIILYYVDDDNSACQFMCSVRVWCTWCGWCGRFGAVWLHTSQSSAMSIEAM